MTLLEVCVDTIEALERAQRSGAARLELCERLDLGGLSPSREFLERALAAAKVPLHVMVRPRAGDFVYSDVEFDAMKRELQRLRDLPVAGAVFGVLKPDSTVDMRRTRELVERSRPMSVTFHRAFDDVPDKVAALEQLIELGIERVLTSGDAPNAFDGRALLRKLVAEADERIIVLPGGGVRAHNAAHIVADTGVRELHSSTPFQLGVH
jgi:copper homeostasis protein